METAATPEVPGSNLGNVRAGSPKRKLTFWLLSGLAVIALGLVGFLCFMAGRDPIARSVTVTFLGYTNSDTRGFNSQYRWAWFRITNGSRIPLFCQQGVIDVERETSWSHDISSAGRMYDQSSVEPGKSMTVSVIAPLNGTRWRNNFLFRPVTFGSPSPKPWKFRFIQFANRLPLGRGLKARLYQWLFEASQPHTITSEVLKL